MNTSHTTMSAPHTAKSLSPASIEGCVFWYHGGTMMRDRLGCFIWLNDARRVTWWRKLRNWLRFYESDTLCSFTSPDELP